MRRGEHRMRDTMEQVENIENQTDLNEEKPKQELTVIGGLRLVLVSTLKQKYGCK